MGKVLGECGESVWRLLGEGGERLRPKYTLQFRLIFPTVQKRVFGGQQMVTGGQITGHMSYKRETKSIEA